MAELKANSTLGTNLIATATSVALQEVVNAPWDNTFSTSILVAYKSNNALTWHGADDKSVIITSPPIYTPSFYTLLSNVSSVSEGGSVQFDLTTHKVSDGTVLYYDIVSLTGNVTANDFSSSVSGSFSVTANSANIILAVANDKTTEGTESFRFQVRTDNASGNIVASSNVIVIDVSLTPTYALSSNVSTVPEGSSVLVTLTTTEVDQGTTIPYTISGGVTTDDFDPALSSLTGNFTADSNGSDTLELTVAADGDSSEIESIIVTLGATDSDGFSTGSPSVSISIEQPVAGQNAYTSAGAYDFTVPEGVTSVSAVAVGGGGGAAGFPTGTTYKWPGAGGGGGATAWATIPVTPGEVLTVGVGAGGVGGTNASGVQAGKTGSPGSNSYIGRKEYYYLPDITYRANYTGEITTYADIAGIAWKPDGTRLFIGGSLTDTITQYELSIPWDITTVYLDGLATDLQVNTEVISGESYIKGIALNPEGTIMYVAGPNKSNIDAYTLSSAWEVNTASWNGSALSVTSQTNYPTGIAFNSTGTKVYVAHNTYYAYQYDLSTAWDISTASYSGNSLYRNSQQYQDISVGKDDTRLYVSAFVNSNFSGTGNHGYFLREYSLPEDGNLSNASLLSTTDLYGLTPSADPIFMRGHAWSKYGHRLYTVDDDVLYEWNTSSSNTEIIVQAGGGNGGLWSYQSYQATSGGTAYANTSLVTSYGLYNGGSGGASWGFNNTGGGGGGAGGYADANVTISGSYGRGGGQSGGVSGASSSYQGAGGAAGGGGVSSVPAGNNGRGGGGVGILGRGSDGIAVSDGYGEGGSGGSNATSASGGAYGGGGGAPGGPSNNSSGWYGGYGAPGAVRIIYGPGRSYPDTYTADQ